MPKIYYENSEGVHLEGNRSDYTLCGFTLDGDPSLDMGEPVVTDKRIITCVECIAVIKHCRDVVIKE